MTTTTTIDLDRSIYPMPMFVTVPVRDMRATERLYAAAGFFTLATVDGPDGPVLLHLRRMKHQDILVTPGEGRAGSLTVSFAAGDADLDATAEALRDAGADVEGPIDTAWFSRDVRFTDPDGHTVILTAPRMAEAMAAREWVADSISGDFTA